MFNILVVEDHQDMLELFCTVLTKHGYNCIPARNGNEALTLLDTHYIDV